MCPVLQPKCISYFLIFPNMYHVPSPLWPHTCCLLCLKCSLLPICLASLPFEPQLIAHILKGLAETSCAGFEASSGLANNQRYLLHNSSRGPVIQTRMYVLELCNVAAVPPSLLRLPLAYIFLSDFYCTDLFTC